MSDNTPKNRLLNHLERLAEQRDERDKLQPDAELLALYLEAGDMEAMEQLIRRYSTMVATVCRLTVSDAAHAEDAFQATFLVLLQSAKKIQKRASIAAWLHGVAYRTASRIRSKHYSTPTHSKNSGCDDVIKPCDDETDPASELARKMELEALDRELENLPERLRAPLVEHYLLGHSAPEIAERMELSLSAVEGRLKRGRRKLRTLLARRGISLSVLAAGSLFFQNHLAASESAAWASNFVDSHLPSGDMPADAQPPLSPNPEVSSLVQGEMMMLGMSAKSSIAAAIMVTAGALAVWAADPFDHGQGNQQSGSSGRASVAHADATVQAVAPAPAEPVKFFPPNAEATAPANTLGQFGGGEGVQGGLGGGGFGGGAIPDVPVVDPVAWTKPEGEAPAWLSAGSRAVSGAEKHRMKLSEEFDFDWNATPLRDVIEQIADEHVGVQIEISVDELDLLGVDVDTPITATGQGPMREVFRRILKPLELTYRVNESSIEITSKEAAESNPAIRFYDLSFILPNTANLDSLQNAIQQTIDPDSWYENGGTGSITNVGSMMVIGAPEEVHQKVEVFLMKIGEMNPKNLEAPVQRAMGGGSNGGGMF